MTLRVALTVLLGSGMACAPGTAGDDRVSVVAGFYPLAEAAERVGGDRVRVTNLTPAGVEPHDLELTTRDVDAVLDAHVVLYLGGGFQPALEEAAVRDREGLAVDVLDEVDTLSAPPGQEERADPHVWLDPQRMAGIVEAVAGALGRADPGHRAGYAEDAAAFAEELRALDAEFREGLADCERDVIVTAHAAFGYLADRYGLRQEAISGLSPEAEPDPQRLDELVALVEREGVTTIFTEALVSPEVARTLAREVGVRTDVLNPLEGLTSEQEAAGETYVTVMRDNLGRLQAALECEGAST